MTEIFDLLDAARGGVRTDVQTQTIITFDGERTVAIWQQRPDGFERLESLEVQWDGQTASALDLEDILDRYLHPFEVLHSSQDPDDLATAQRRTFATLQGATYELWDTFISSYVAAGQPDGHENVSFAHIQQQGFVADPSSPNQRWVIRERSYAG